MKITRKFTGILLVILLLTAMFSIAVSASEPIQHIPAADEAGFYSLNNITGSVGNPISATVIITVNGNGFNSLAVNSNVTDWFKNLPAAYSGTDFVARVQSAVRAGDTEMTITLTGTPGAVASSAVLIEIPANRLRNGTESGNSAVMLTASDPGVKWDIKATHKVTMPATNDASLANGTLTATGATFRVEDGERVAYVTDGTKITFTAAPKATYGVDAWSLPALSANDEEAKGLTRTVEVTAPIDVTIDFEKTFTAYRIAEVTVGGDVVKQGGEDDENEIIYNDPEAEAVEMKFGNAPVILNKDNSTIEVVTDWNTAAEGATPNYAAVPTTGADFNLSIASRNTAVVKVVEVTAGNKNSVNTELAKYTGSLTADVGDLILYPQGSGTTTITITAKRKTDATVKLAEGKIEFNITVEMPETNVTLDETNGTVTAVTTNVYGDATLTIVLDLRKEVVAKGTSASAAGFSHNGTSWTALAMGGTKADTDISRVFDKSGTLSIAEKFSGGRPAPGSAVWEIAEIEPRQKTPKLKVFYGDPDGDELEDMDTNTWTVTGHDFEDEDLPDLLFATSADKKNPDNPKPEKAAANPGQTDKDVFGFVKFDPDNAPKVKDLPKDGKVLQSVYLFKVAAGMNDDEEDDEGNQIITLSPASKFVKVTVSSQIKPANINVDYKKERVALKAGMAYYYGSMTDADKTVMTKADAAIGLLFKDEDADAPLLGSTGNTNLTYWTAANGKKPRSKEQKIIVHNYSKWSDNSAVASGFDKTKRTYRLPRDYEVRPLDSNGKWVTSIPKVTSTVEYEIRRKGTARYDGTGKPWLKGGTRTASEVRKLTIVVDEYKAGKDKNKEDIMKTGIISVKVEALTP